ncbi:isoprenyl transferase, partial [Rhodococcus hoagii]|nr:isoprenyl transferase [Prescottella equi]
MRRSGRMGSVIRRREPRKLSLIGDTPAVPAPLGRPPAHPAARVDPHNHVALVMDGNGRWAQDRGLPRTAGHERG